MLHHVPQGLSPELAGLATPMANGMEWSLFDGGVGYDSTVLIQGPGQQGLSQTVVYKQAGASLIIVTGTSKDAARLAVARTLGADHVIDVQQEDALTRIMEITGGRGVDVVLDCTRGGRHAPRTAGHRCPQAQGRDDGCPGRDARVPELPDRENDALKFITLRSARGHSYRACELALQQLASTALPAGAGDDTYLRPERHGLRDQVGRWRRREGRDPRVPDALAVTNG